MRTIDRAEIIKHFKSKSFFGYSGNFNLLDNRLVKNSGNHILLWRENIDFFFFYNIEHSRFYIFVGGWAGWSEWSSWGKGLCSGNQRVKTRACTNPLPQSGSDYCDGENAIQQDGPGIIISQ